MPEKREPNRNLIVIRILAFLLLMFAIVIAVFNYEIARESRKETQHFWHMIYMYFEHLFRAFTVLLGSWLSYRFYKQSKSGALKQTKITLLGFSLSALILLVLWPLLSGYWELYNALMPFPWSTLPFQLLITGKSFGTELPAWYGIDSVTLVLWTYLVYQVTVFGGTLILGRKWQCSILCLLNGCHAESLGAALPLFSYNKKRPHSRQVHPLIKKIMLIARNMLFAVNLLLIAGWIVNIAAGYALIAPSALLKAETLKYLSLELTLLMLLWFVIGGRGYCYYCPAGLGLALVSRPAGQQVETGLTRCTGCGACNAACKMSIDIMAKAKTGKPVQDLSCVGCGLCVDSCPTGNLRYSTCFTRKFFLREGK